MPPRLASLLSTTVPPIQLGLDPGRCLFAGIAQLGEHQIEDLKVACSIHAHRTYLWDRTYPFLML